MLRGDVFRGEADLFLDSNAINRSTHPAGRFILYCSIKFFPNICIISFSNSMSTPEMSRINYFFHATDSKNRYKMHQKCLMQLRDVVGNSRVREDSMCDDFFQTEV